jgi:hypothetical protein
MVRGVINSGVAKQKQEVVTMKKLSGKMKEEALRDIQMYFGEPPYNVENVRRCHSSGLFEQQSLAKYGLTPIELISVIQAIHLTEERKKEAVKDIKMYFGELPVSEEVIGKRLSSGLLEMQILAKYSMTVNDLMKEVGDMGRN